MNDTLEAVLVTLGALLPVSVVLAALLSVVLR